MLTELNNSYGQRQEQNLIDSIKQEVLMDLGSYRFAPPPGSEKDLVGEIKNEVLAQIQREMYPNSPAVSGRSDYLDRKTIESIKKEVIAQVKAEPETRD